MTSARAGIPQSRTHGILVLALLAALVVLPLALSPRAEAFVYWTNSSTNAIGRANLDGTGVDERFIGGTELPGAVAVDGHYIYWAGYGQVAHPTEEQGAAIARARLDGTKVDWTFIPNATNGPQVGIRQIAVDDDHIYWTEVFSHAGVTPAGSISRANLDGTGVERQFITGFAEGAVPTGLAVDANHIYWSQSGGIYPSSTQTPAIGRANLDGTGVERAFIPFPSGSYPGAVEVDDSYVYWINSRPDAFSSETIGRANLDGSGVDQSFIDGFGAHTNFPFDLAVDAGHLYWVDLGVQEFSGMIGRAGLDGANVDEGFITPAQRASPVGVAVNFSLGKLKKDKERGTAKLTVEVPASGAIALAETKKLKGAEIRAEAAGEVQLSIKPQGRAKKKLTQKGKVKVQAEVTYTLDGGEPEIQTTTLKLVKRS
jgi:virginiamycin B lyase